MQKIRRIYLVPYVQTCRLLACEFLFERMPSMIFINASGCYFKLAPILNFFIPQLYENIVIKYIIIIYYQLYYLNIYYKYIIKTC